MPENKRDNNMPVRKWLVENSLTVTALVMMVAVAAYVYFEDLNVLAV